MSWCLLILINPVYRKLCLVKNEWSIYKLYIRRDCALLASGSVYSSQPRQTLVVKSGSDRSTAKRSVTNMSVTGPRNNHYKGMLCDTVGVA